jgi:phosphomannomutase
MNRIGPTSSFLDHAPVSLTFGTSGLRGLVKDITDLEAYVNVKGALRYLLDRGDIRIGDSIVLAGDLRPSTDRIMRACARAIVDSGSEVENAGKIPTPALILHAISTGRAGVMVSGSHIPFDRNGIKLNKSGGEILKSDEPGITREVERVRVEEYGRTSIDSAFAPSGMFKTSRDLPPVDGAAEERYVRRYLNSFAVRGLEGLRVLVYEHSAVGRDTLGRILRELGAEVATAGRAETFIPIDTENVTDELLDRLEGLVAAEGSGRLDAVVSTDGDSDRPLVAAVLPRGETDPRGRHVRFLSGDLLGIVVAEYLRADAVVVPISANDAVERRMIARGVLLRKTKIGSPYVVSGIDELRSTGAHSRIVGWEANGGFLLGSAIPLGREVMDRLPTRDATLPILTNLSCAREQRIGLAALWDRLPARFGRAGLIDDVPVAVSKAILAHLVPAGDTVEVEVGGEESVKGSGPPGGAPAPLAEPAAAVWRERKATLARFFTPALGFDDIVRINVLDGVRVYFRNGDVAHVRPSGNAPQLRIYANGDSQERADHIVELGLREPDGILRRLERAFT